MSFTEVDHILVASGHALSLYGIDSDIALTLASVVVAAIAVLRAWQHSTRLRKIEERARAEHNRLVRQLELEAAARRQKAPEIARAPLEKAKLEVSREIEPEAPSVEKAIGLPPEEPLQFEPDRIPEEPPAASLATGLGRTREHFFSRLSGLFSRKPQIDESFFGELEELLILSDVGVHMAQRLIADLKARAASLTPESIVGELKANVLEILRNQVPVEVRAGRIDGQPQVIFFVGVNGVGKTTTIGKLSEQLRSSGAKVLVGACDTFRAAAVDQMEVWAQRAGVDIEKGEPDAKPSTVAYKTIHRALTEGYDIVLIDTAGRLHTKVNLMNELAAVTQIVSRELPGAPHETLLVVDASTGQNALQQAREFHAKASLTGIVVTKLDGTPKGGIVIAIRDELGVPIRYIGIGEGVHDLRPFVAEEFVDALFEKGDRVAETEAMSARAQIRRRRREAANAE